MGREKVLFSCYRLFCPVKAWAGGRDDPQSSACQLPAVARPHKRSQMSSGCPCHLGNQLLGCWPRELICYHLCLM